jgi:hydrogenase-4 component F
VLLALPLLIPALAGLLCFAVGSARVRWLLLLAGAVGHALAVGVLFLRPPAPLGWLRADELGLLFLAITSTLFLLVTIYSGAQRQSASGHPERVFSGALLLFLAAMSLVCVTQHFGVIWVAVEATTLASAPLIYHHRSARSLEAAWKYLVLCSVGIAIALLGTFLLALAAPGAGDPLWLPALLRADVVLDHQLLRVAFIFLLVGYGTKVGLAPLHSWLPDAHSEAPSPASALLSGALLNTAFLAVLRAWQVLGAAGEHAFGSALLVGFGLLSLALAAAFIVGQRDYKRMLAYSSMEHMGILALAVGVAGAASYGALLHALNHSLAKALLFLAAGNILVVYGTKSIADVRGVGRRLPWTGALWVIGFLAIAGSPPFGLFISEFLILKATLEQGRFVVAGLYLLLLAAIFAGLASSVLRMTHGSAGEATEPGGGEPWQRVLPPALLAGAVLVLGIYIPEPLHELLRRAAALLGSGA